jgi:pyrimidine-nucleoside phosphorylase
MRAVDIIARKRDGQALDDAEIRWFIDQYSKDELPDYQTSALLMAIYLRGMDDRETATLTAAMVESGQTLDLASLPGKVVDKHSSGGVGDKTTLVVGPIVAAAGLPVAKMSGRGLGFTGGTIDKLESIPGFDVNLPHERFMKQVEEVGLVISGTSASLAPADGKLYALRDVTATVSSLPLIASSIMSKKLAAGADAIVLDVKVGQGAFMQTLDEARALARAMVAIGARMERAVTALLSDMNQPLGRAIGNALEVVEAVETLHGQGPPDFEEHCLAVSAHMILLGEKAATLEGAHELAEQQLRSGAAWRKFVAMVAAQDGDTGYIEDCSILPRAAVVETIGAPSAGYLAAIDAREVGTTVVELGGGRARKGDEIDPAVGVVLRAKVGDHLIMDAPLFDLHASSMAQFAAARDRLLRALSWSDAPVEPPPLFYDVISSQKSV